MRLATVVEMQGRDLLRRRLALLLIVAVPLLFAATQRHSGEAPFTGGIGTAFSVTGAALFAMLASRPVDPRLLLAGYSRADLIVGRLLLLLGVGLGICGVFCGFLAAFAEPPRLERAAVGVLLVALVAVPLGLALATLLPRELEGTLAIIGLVGIEEQSLHYHYDSVAARLLPHYGAARYLLASEYGFTSVSARWALYSLAWALGLLVTALWLWLRRVRVWRR
jgi:hypothetical protein